MMIFLMILAKIKTMKSEQISTILDKPRQVWTTLDNFGQLWTTQDKFVLQGGWDKISISKMSF
jgi:hypothetical protein